MNKIYVMASLAALLAACGEQGEQSQFPEEVSKAAQPSQTGAVDETAPPVDKAALVEQAQAAVQALGGALKGELEAAIKAGGPVAAMSVCKIKAPELAKSITDDQGMSVKRVSLKNRNLVMGAANAWQTKVLNDFETRKVAGENPAMLAYAEVVDQEFRFMKAIPTAAVCLGCHGASLSPEVTAKLAELYPQDKATGYNEGDLRGAFVVVKNLAPQT